ncbi:MAG TPA: L-histidine N(alpha)-methyltransferase [Hyphomicrobiaceae bacterium]|nr:L-histidine N(alpha)-methyltransferase [Hyphomicrobiaceae bacterium]
MTRRAQTSPAERPAEVGLCEFAGAVLKGLSAPRKRLPCQYFYDAAGSRLFEEITELEEYYPTRTETAILRTHAHAMARPSGRSAVLVEFGSGSSRKTELVLAALEAPRAYVPIDVSWSALEEARSRLERRFPWLEVVPVNASFCDALRLPVRVSSHPKLGFFPGSTIGNFDPPDAGRLLQHFARILGPGSRLIVGVDLDKDTRRLVPAYDDAKGVTARFNLNLLARINRELGGDFDLASFRHRAVYDRNLRRIEMHLVSSVRQAVRLLGRSFEFAAGESIHTENSYKYSVEQFRGLARGAGWRSAQVWMDAGRDFSVHELRLPTA